MSLRSKNRKWIFPEKSDSFNSSYDNLLDWFETLDAEFGKTLEFSLSEKPKFIVEYVSDLKFKRGIRDGDIAFVTSERAFYKYDYGKKDWVLENKRVPFPILSWKNPTKDDKYENGTLWINENSGEHFTSIGTFEYNGVKETIWVDSRGQRISGFNVSDIFFIFPIYSFRYKTKKSLILEGENKHIENYVNEDGAIIVPKGDSAIELYIGDFIIGKMPILSTGQSLVEFDFFYKNGSLPEKLDITPKLVYKFERFLTLLHTISQFTSGGRRVFKEGLIFNYPIEDLISGKCIHKFFSDNGLVYPTKEEIFNIKETFRSFISTLDDNIMNIQYKERSIRLLGPESSWGNSTLYQDWCSGGSEPTYEICNGFDIYDGNIYYIDGNEVYVNGNEEPC